MARFLRCVPAGDLIKINNNAQRQRHISMLGYALNAVYVEQFDFVKRPASKRQQ